MSLILEALKKLEREKSAPDRGFLVMAAAPWPARRRGSWVALGLLLAGVAAGGAAVALWATRTNAPRVDAPGAEGPQAEGPHADAPRASAEPARPTPNPESALTSVPLGARTTEGALPAVSPPSSRPGAASVPAAPAPVAAGEPDTPATTASVVEPPDHALAEPAPSDPAPAMHPAPWDPDALRLEAVSERDGRPVALVSGRLLREGDSFEGVRILRIGPTEVEVEVRGQRRTLRF